jgi:hypothetical protein
MNERQFHDWQTKLISEERAMDADIIGGFPYSDPNCKGCGKPLDIEHAGLTDGCPCNTPLGVNNMNETRWRLLLQSHRLLNTAATANAADMARARDSAVEASNTIASLQASRQGCGLFVIRQKRTGYYWTCSSEHGSGWQPKQPKQSFTKSELSKEIYRLIDQGWFVDCDILQLSVPAVSLMTG